MMDFNVKEFFFTKLISLGVNYPGWLSLVQVQVLML